MAIVAAFQFSNPFPCSISKHLQHQQHQQSKFSFITKAIDNPESNTPPPTDSSEDTSFEKRLEKIKFKSGTGKKAEARKARKSKSSSNSSSGNGNGNVFLPPVPLKEPVSSDGLKVEFGFSRYTERINGRIACLGLVALLLVELATGKSVLNYHSGSIVFIQIYFIAAVSAVYVKYEKEKISVWPQ